MNLCRYFLSFAVFSFIGWAYETVYYTIQQKKMINSGFLSTCFCPIYGIGALLDLLILGRIENTFVLFVAGMIVTGTLEYFVSCLLESLFGRRWWDYTGHFMNINGRICLLGAVCFGLGGMLLNCYLLPCYMKLYHKIAPKWRWTLCGVCLAVFVLDITYCAVRPNMGYGISG